LDVGSHDLFQLVYYPQLSHEGRDVYTCTPFEFYIPYLINAM